MHIILHRRETTTRPVADLVRELAKLNDDKGRQKLADLRWFAYNDFNRPDVTKLEAVLTEMRDRRCKPRERGFDV